jgi:predicted RNA binding protein YcfA (HicA-like mRNA interferase family)
LNPLSPGNSNFADSGGKRKDFLDASAASNVATSGVSLCQVGHSCELTVLPHPNYVCFVKVRDILRLIEQDGWYLVRTRGSHRQYKHPSKPGLVTVPGKPGDDFAPGTLNSPVSNEEYATQIARDWNAKSSGSGFVTRFQMNASFLSAYDVHTVGSANHTEYWIPAEDLPQFNENIIGNIEVIAEYRRE